MAHKELDKLPESADPAILETDLTLLGLVALIDMPRIEAPAAVADCRMAGNYTQSD